MLLDYVADHQRGGQRGNDDEGDDDESLHGS